MVLFFFHRGEDRMKLTLEREHFQNSRTFPSLLCYCTLKLLGKSWRHKHSCTCLLRSSPSNLLRPKPTAPAHRANVTSRFPQFTLTTSNGKEELLGELVTDCQGRDSNLDPANSQLGKLTITPQK